MGMTNAGFQNRQYAPFRRFVWSKTRLREGAPAESLLTLDEVKDWLGIPLSDTSQDALLQGLIDASTQEAERYTGRAFVNRDVKEFFDYVPYIESRGGMGGSVNTSDITMEGGRVIECTRLPLSEVLRIAWHKEDGTSIDPWDVGNYMVDAESPDIKGRVIIKDSVTVPTSLQVGNGLEVEYVAGYGPTADDVPYGIKHAVLMLLAFNYQNRGDCGGSGEVNPLKASGAVGALRQYRLKEVV